MPLKPPVFLVRPGRHSPATGELFPSAFRGIADGVHRLGEHGLGRLALVFAATRPEYDTTGSCIAGGLVATFIEDEQARERLSEASANPGAVDDLDAFLDTTLIQAGIDQNEHHGLVVVTSRSLIAAAQGRSALESLTYSGLVQPYTPGSWPRPEATA